MSIPFKKVKDKLGLDDFFDFGKYNGCRVSTIVKSNPGYISWCIDTIGIKFHFSVLEAAIKYSLEMPSQRRYNRSYNNSGVWHEKGDYHDQDFGDWYAEADFF